MKINLGLSAPRNALALINLRNPTLNLDMNNVTIGVPEAYSQIGSLMNTRLLVTAIKNKGYKGTKWVKYIRYPLALNMIWQSTLIDVTGYTANVETIKTRLLSLFGLMASEVDFSTFTVPNGSADVSVTLTAKTTSLLYLPGSTWTFKIKIPADVTLNGTTGTATAINVYTAMGSPTYPGKYKYVVRGNINSNGSGVALDTGAFPAGCELTIVNQGYIRGFAGKGGNYNTAGGAGGDAVKCSCDCTLDNTAGYIYGGGGGGGGAACSNTGGVAYLRAAGGSGAGSPAAAAGTGTGSSLVLDAQTTKTATQGNGNVAGVGARIQTNTATLWVNGGDGGTPGQAGKAGTSGNMSIWTFVVQPGGAAGKAILKNGKTVTILGNTTDRVVGAVAS